MKDVRDRERQKLLAKSGRKPKLTPAQYAARFEAESARQRRRYGEALRLWLTCRFGPCRKHKACHGNRNACLKRALGCVPQTVQWQARQDILKATPANIGAPERAARQLMPRDLL